MVSCGWLRIFMVELGTQTLELGFRVKDIGCTRFRIGVSGFRKNQTGLSHIDFLEASR